jgi:hypothetical protein
MTEPTNTDKARYVIERLGLEWIERPPHAPGCICYTCNHYNTPTFLDPAGRIQLLELMMGRFMIGCYKDYDSFAGYLRGEGLCISRESNLMTGPEKHAIFTDVIIDKDNTGLLLDASYRFLKEKEK